MTAAARPLLRNPTFSRLWFIQAATQVGGNMALYAMTILVFATTRSNASVSVLVATYVVPQIVFSPFAGVIVDRLDLRVALVGPNVVRSILMIGLAASGADIPVLLLLNLGVSATSVALTPAEGSMIPRIVPADQLATAMGIFNLTLQGSFALGFAFLGPVLVTLVGPSAVLALVAVLYVAATVACVGLPSAHPLVRDDASTARAAALGPLHELREGLAVVRQDRAISRPILHQAVATAVAGVLGVVGPAFAVALGLPPDRFAVIVVPLGLGVVLGALGQRRLGSTGRRRAAEAGLVVLGVMTASLALLPPLRDALAASDLAVLPLMVLLAVVAGAAYAVTSVSAQTALLEAMPAAVRGRVFGVLASVLSTASLLPALVAGPLADRVSPPVVLGLAGLAVVALSGASARSQDPRSGTPADRRAGEGGPM